MKKIIEKKSNVVGSKKLTLKTKLVAGAGTDPGTGKIASNHNAPVKVEPKTEKKQTMKIKTKLMAGEGGGERDKISANHNTPAKTEKKKLVLKTRIVAGEGGGNGPKPPGTSLNHNTPVKSDKKLKLKTRLVAGTGTDPNTKIAQNHNARMI